MKTIHTHFPFIAAALLAAGCAALPSSQDLDREALADPEMKAELKGF